MPLAWGNFLPLPWEMWCNLLARNFIRMRHRKTELGRQTFKERNNSLTPGQRSALILFDGAKDDEVILKALASTGFSHEDIQHLVDKDLIEACDDAQSRPGMGNSGFANSGFAGMSGFGANSGFPASTQNFPATGTTLSEQDRYKLAYPIATKLTSGLGFRGFRLNLSVESVSSYTELMALAPKIRAAVGDEKFLELYRALKGY